MTSIFALKYFCQRIIFNNFTIMKHIKVNRSILWSCYVFQMMLFTAVSCYPALPVENLTEIKDERQFPNGTTIGKYTYMDSEGNPIQVKYYADNSSYGVELKSIKVVEQTSDKLIEPAQLIKDTLSKFDRHSYGKMDSDTINSNHILPTVADFKYKEHEYLDPYDFLKKEVRKTKRYKTEKPNPDYDIFYQNELKGDKQCSKNKVRVYVDDKYKRKTRSADNKYVEANKFCEQF